MFVGQDYENTGCNRHHAVSLLLANDPNLLGLIFGDTWQVPLPAAFANLVASERKMDRQIKLLIALALEIWWDRQVASMHQVYRYLSKIRFDGLLMAMELLFASGGCDCPNCRQRLMEKSPVWRSNSQLF